MYMERTCEAFIMCVYDSSDSTPGDAPLLISGLNALSRALPTDIDLVLLCALTYLELNRFLPLAYL